VPELALFDFDGTLTQGETFPPFVRSVVPAERLRAGQLRLAPLVLGYRLGLVSGTRIRAAVVARALAGMDAADFEDAARAWAGRELPGLLRPAALARLRAHRDRGDTVRVVSGNFEALLAPWAASEGVVALGSRLEVRDGRLTGRYAGPQCVLEEKVARIRAELELSRFARIHAYGDTPEDRPMLLLADVAHYLPRGWPEGLDPTRLD
jgi:HAD superfamily hydrolase (TIGR01490 family)